ncbi:terminase small subunit [Aromatoleum toluclasticum]|uniref:terminase small subunit n=1 Tax=Aromatoleum toluclasticum TaxID=92003 RepID=UPI00037B965F|nr:terminase small subunit [Aromatoleum toluclasticum]
MSQQAVSGLCADLGIDWRTASLDEVRVRYIRRLREQAAGRAAAGDLDLAGERARLAKEQADRVAMQNAVTRGELAPVQLIEEVLAKAGARAAKILDTIPGTIRRREPSLSADTIAAIAKDIAKVRNIAAAVSLADLREDDQADEAGDSSGALDVEA